jgi:hypothetical protein
MLAGRCGSVIWNFMFQRQNKTVHTLAMWNAKKIEAEALG